MKNVGIVIALMIGAQANAAATATAIASVTPTCTMIKDSGQIVVSCNDGTKSVLNYQPVMNGAVHVADANGRDWPNLVYMGPMQVLNRTSGDVLTYESNGNLQAVTAVFFEGTSCNGHAFIHISNYIVMNQVYLNVNAFPAGGDGIKIVGQPSAPTFIQSYYSQGKCVKSSQPNQTNLAIVQSVSIPSSDPKALAQPMYMISQ